MVTSMTKSSESHEESEHQLNSSAEYLEHAQDIQAAKLAGASDIRHFKLEKSALQTEADEIGPSTQSQISWRNSTPRA